VDYKTGDFKFDKTKIKYGVDMQLPIYAYLLKCCYPEYTTTGMYVQNVCLDKPEENKERYYLDGITLSNLGKIKRLDTSINTQLTPDEKPNSNSHFIKKIKLTKQGALGKSSSSIIPQAEIDNLVETAKTQIELANENIKSMKFDIAPLNVINKSHGDIIKPYCQYCPYGDICFHDKNDINVIVDNKEE
jgi:ATP-dependent helicase/DNAse subunit B